MFSQTIYALINDIILMLTPRLLRSSTSIYFGSIAVSITIGTLSNLSFSNSTRCGLQLYEVTNKQHLSTTTRLSQPYSTIYRAYNQKQLYILSTLIIIRAARLTVLQLYSSQLPIVFYASLTILSISFQNSTTTIVTLIASSR